MENSRVDPSFLVYAETEIAVRAGMKNACLGENGKEKINEKACLSFAWGGQAPCSSAFIMRMD